VGGGYLYFEDVVGGNFIYKTGRQNSSGCKPCQLEMESKIVINSKKLRLTSMPIGATLPRLGAKIKLANHFLNSVAANKYSFLFYIMLPLCFLSSRHYLFVTNKRLGNIYSGGCPAFYINHKPSYKIISSTPAPPAHTLFSSFYYTTILEKFFSSTYQYFAYQIISIDH
jgi:hypothetical protein